MWYKVKKIYVGTQQVRPSWWDPWNNTIAYYPLTSSTTTQDKSWNNRNLTNSWVTFWTYKWIDCAYSNMASLLYNSSFVTNLQNLTVSARAYYVWNWYSWSGNYNQALWRWWSSSSENFWPYIENQYNPWLLVVSPGWFWRIQLTSNSKWVNVVVTYDYNNKTAIMYVDGVAGTSNTNANPPWWTYIRIGGKTSTWWWYGWLSEFIVEWKVWTAQEILDYYNNTKSNYWL